MKPYSAADIAQTTPTASAIAQAVLQGFALGDIQHCALMRRGFNHVYGMHFVDGRKAVARLCAERPRGAPNIEYEAALLMHLKAAGAPVANVLLTREGGVAVAMPLPEGERFLMLFEYLDGEIPGDVLPDIEATGRGLALLHEAGQSFNGPNSLYQKELPDLLQAPLGWLLSASTADDSLRADFAAIAQRLEARIAAMPPLTRVHCHGDCHSGNNHMTDGASGADGADGSEGKRVATFFDFDDAGPGLLAYDLCVYLWSFLPRQSGGVLDAAALERWRRYIAGYRSVRAIASADFEAIAAFVAVRQFWFLGELAGRSAVWGTQALPASSLRRNAALLTEWESLQTPA